MRRRSLLWTGGFTIGLLIWVIASIGLSQAQEKKVYVNGIDPAWPPYQYVDKQGNPTGFDVECAKWIAKEMGFTVKIQPTAWDTIIPALKAKKVDFVTGMGVTEERAKQVDFTAPYRFVGYVVVGSMDTDLNAVTALCMGHNVGILRGSTEERWIEENLIKKGVKIKLKTYETAPLIIEDLINKRIDAGVMTTPPVKDALKAKRPFKIIGPAGIKEGELAYSVRKGDKELLEILNEGLRRLKKSDEWDKLLVKYGIE